MKQLLLDPRTQRALAVGVCQSYDIQQDCYGVGGVDFLHQTADFYNYPENIVTNPPYIIATEFILHAKQIAGRKIAMLVNSPLAKAEGLLASMTTAFYRDVLHCLHKRNFR